MIERAMATSKFPLPVSMTVAVVRTREYPLMFPPTMMEAPTSEITPPKPAMTAARRGSLASFTRIQTIWMRVAPRARICRRSFAGRCWMAGQGDARHDGRCDDRLGEDHGQGRVEDAQESERAVSPEEDRDKEPHHHRRKGHARC